MANAKMDPQAWNGLSEQDKASISHILVTSGLIADGSVEAAFSPADGGGQKMEWNPIKTICTLGCNAAEGVAVAACASLTGPAAAACVLAAHTAADYCRSRC